MRQHHNTLVVEPLLDQVTHRRLAGCRATCVSCDDSLGDGARFCQRSRPREPCTQLPPDPPATPMKNGCERWRRLALLVPGESPAGRLLRHEWLPGDHASLLALRGDRLAPQLDECTSRLKSSVSASLACCVPDPFANGGTEPAACAAASPSTIAAPPNAVLVRLRWWTAAVKRRRLHLWPGTSRQRSSFRVYDTVAD